MKEIHIDICCGARCAMMGAFDLLDKIESLKEEIEGQDLIFPNGSIVVNPVPCTQECKGEKVSKAPIVIIDGEKMTKATAPKVMEKILEATRQ